MARIGSYTLGTEELATLNTLCEEFLEAAGSCTQHASSTQISDSQDSLDRNETQSSSLAEAPAQTEVCAPEATQEPPATPSSAEQEHNKVEVNRCVS